MANQTAWKRDTPGQTLYAYPLSQDIADWATYAVTFTEKGDGGGWYSATLDDTYTDWAIFDTVPSSWDESLYSSISLEAEAGAAGAADGIPYYPTVRRNADDENPIVFSWPSSASLTAQVSLNGGAFAAVAGTIAVVAEVETGLWKYQLSFNAADRPATGVAEYAITDGTDTFYMPLSIDIGGGAGGGEVTVDAFTQNALNQLGAIKVYITNPYNATTRTLTLVQHCEYSDSSIIGPIQFEITQAGVVEGDDIRLKAFGDGTDELVKDGAVVDIGGTLYGQIKLTETETNITDGPDWEFNLLHVSGSGKESPLLAGQAMEVIQSPE